MRKIIAAFGFIIWSSGLAQGADQTILGKQFQLKDPKPGVNATKRTFVGQGLEKGTTHAIVGDPTVTGASLTVFTRGAVPASQIFPLPAGLWAAKRGGFKYGDTKLTAGPVKTVRVQVTKTAFQLKAAVSGKNGGIALTPPNPGIDACLRFEIAGGDRYEVLFPAIPDATIKKNDAKTFLVKAAHAEGPCGFVVDPAGTDHTSVVSAIDLPTNGREAAALGLDIDGKANDGVDNQLGSVLGSFQALLPNLDLQASITRQIDQGTLVLLANVKATALTSAQGVGTWLYAGTTSMTPPACVDGSDVVCRQQFTGTGLFNVDLTGPTDAKLAGSIATGNFIGVADELTVKLTLGGVPLTLPLKKARAELSGMSAAGWPSTNSKIGGAITQADIQGSVLPAMATLIRTTFDEDCDVGGTPPSCGCVGGSTGATMRNLFDKAPTQDCQISDPEVTTVISGFLTPDIDLDDDGTNDAVSLGVGITAVAGTFTVP